MGVDLLRGDERFSLNVKLWNACLELARTFGWKPEGTLYPTAEVDAFGIEADRDALAVQWNGSYSCTERQRVSDSDAEEMGSSLLRAAAALRAGTSTTEEQAGALRQVEEIRVSRAENLRNILDLSDQTVADKLKAHFGDEPTTTGFFEELAMFLIDGGFEIA